MMKFVLAVIFGFFSISNSLVYRITKASTIKEFQGAIRLRFPTVTDNLGISELFALYLPEYDDSKTKLDTYICTDPISKVIIGALDINPLSHYILNLTVSENFRRLGIATSLLVHAFSKQKKYDKNDEMSLMVENHNRAARNLYEGQGYALKDGTPKFYGSKFCPRILVTLCKKI